MSIEVMKQCTPFRPAEAFVQRISLAAAILCALLILVRGVEVDILAHSGGLGTALLIIALGMWYRHTGRDDRIGSTAICAGWFIIFTLALSSFNYLLLPHWAPTIDQHLIALDTVLFGYHWPDFVERSAQYPLLNEAMRYAYLSTLPQIALLIVTLGLTGRLGDMYLMMIAVVISGTMTVVFWGWFPSLGPSAIHALPPELLSKARPVVDTLYGQQILAHYQQGLATLSPDEIRGLIAFPSFHIVLALAATYYSRNVPWAFPAFLSVNILVIPAVLAHGGHHVVDIPAGLLVFAIGAYLAPGVVMGPQPKGQLVPGNA